MRYLELKAIEMRKEKTCCRCMTKKKLPEIKMKVNAFANIVANWKLRCVICATHGRKDTASKKKNGTLTTNPTVYVSIVSR